MTKLLLNFIIKNIFTYNYELRCYYKFRVYMVFELKSYLIRRAA